MRAAFIPVLVAAIALAAPAPQTPNPTLTPNAQCIATCVDQAQQQNPADFAQCQQGQADDAAVISCVCALPQARSDITTCFLQQSGCNDQVEVLDAVCEAAPATGDGNAGTPATGNPGTPAPGGNPGAPAPGGNPGTPAPGSNAGNAGTPAPGGNAGNAGTPAPGGNAGSPAPAPAGNSGTPASSPPPNSGASPAGTSPSPTPTDANNAGFHARARTGGALMALVAAVAALIL